ncbi:hypothetical protein BC937DRAFT_86712 [Endogone sp. FLAS-F59071]|nr:hypothetical protein BC937DRAFT_86712 [Endogone sp. FLAS-F59071]|eukprot:RUS19918.1 hypothetical protein BC937DRAFT_86712 [Endogone sp. FLAS-F59071]
MPRHKINRADDSDDSDDMPILHSDDSTDSDDSDDSDDIPPPLLSDDNDENVLVRSNVDPNGESEEEEEDDEEDEEDDDEDDDDEDEDYEDYEDDEEDDEEEDEAKETVLGGLGPKKSRDTDSGKLCSFHDLPLLVLSDSEPEDLRKYRPKKSAEEKARLEREEEEKAERHRIEDENNKKAREETRRARKEERVAAKSREKERLEREREKRVDETVEALSRGSLCAMRGEWRDAFTAYRPIVQPLLEPDAASPPEKLAKHDLNVLKYVFGLACFHTDRLDSAAAAFEHILAHDPGHFPLAHLALGAVHLHRHQYREARATLEEGNHLLSTCEPVPVQWPELDESVPESELEALKREMWARLTEARHPPAPDAMCRVDMCLVSFREIWWDPTKADEVYHRPTKVDEVYHRIECDSKRRRCVLEYHKKCYRKLMKGIGQGDSLLGRECPTPDCDGLIVAYHRLYGDGGTKDSKRLSNVEAQHIRDTAAGTAKLAQPEVVIAEITKKNEKKERTDKNTKKAKKLRADTPPKVAKEDAAKPAAPEPESEPVTIAGTTDAVVAKDAPSKDTDASAMVTRERMRRRWEALQPEDESAPMLDGKREEMFDEWLNIQLNDRKRQGARKPRPEPERAPPPSIEAEDISKGVVMAINRKQQRIEEMEEMRRLAEAKKKKEKAKEKESERRGEEDSTGVEVGVGGGKKKKKKNKFVPLEGWYSQEGLTEPGTEDEIDRVIQRVTGQPSGKGKARYEPTTEEILEEEQMRRVIQESLDYQSGYSRYPEGILLNSGEASWTMNDSVEGYDENDKAVLIPFSEDPRWRSTDFAPPSLSNAFNGTATAVMFHAAGDVSSALAPPATNFGWENTDWDTQAIAQQLGWVTNADFGSPGVGNGLGMMITEEWHPKEEVVRPASNDGDMHIVTWESTSIVDDFLRGFVDEDDDANEDFGNAQDTGVVSSQPPLDPNETAEQDVSRPERITVTTPCVKSSMSQQTDDPFSSRLSNLISLRMSQPLKAIVPLPPLRSADPLWDNAPPTVNVKLSDLEHSAPPTVNVKLSDLIQSVHSNNTPNLPVNSSNATFGALPDWLNDVTETGVNGQTVVISKEKAELMQFPSPPSSSSSTQPSISPSAVHCSSLSSDSSQMVEVGDFLTRLHKHGINTPAVVSPTSSDRPDWPNMKERAFSVDAAEFIPVSLGKASTDADKFALISREMAFSVGAPEFVPQTLQEQEFGDDPADAAEDKYFTEQGYVDQEQAAHGSQLPAAYDYQHPVDPPTYDPNYAYGYEYDQTDFLPPTAPQFPPLPALSSYFVPPLEPGHSSPTSPTYPPSGPASPVWLQHRQAYYSSYGPLDYVELVQPVVEVSGNGKSPENAATPLFQIPQQAKKAVMIKAPK